MSTGWRQVVVVAVMAAVLATGTTTASAHGPGEAGTANGFEPLATGLVSTVIMAPLLAFAIVDAIAFAREREISTQLGFWQLLVGGLEMAITGSIAFDDDDSPIDGVATAGFVLSSAL